MIKHTQSDLILNYLELIKSALKCIGPAYFKLATTYEPSGIVRERVFCYELYHQIRRSMNRYHKLSLNGEIDKRGHVDFKPEHQKNPDFVFHIPGEHEKNTLVIEVKGRLDYGSDSLAADLQTILSFINCYRYRAGIFILYNHSFQELTTVVGRRLRDMATDMAADAIFILCIKKPREHCEEHILTEFRGMHQL